MSKRPGKTAVNLWLDDKLIAEIRRIRFAPADQPLLEPEDMSTRIRILLQEAVDKRKDSGR